MPTGKAEHTDLFGLVPMRSELPPPLLTAFRRKQGWEGPRWGHCALHCFPVFLGSLKLDGVAFGLGPNCGLPLTLCGMLGQSNLLPGPQFLPL